MTWVLAAVCINDCRHTCMHFLMCARSFPRYCCSARSLTGHVSLNSRLRACTPSCTQEKQHQPHCPAECACVTSYSGRDALHFHCLLHRMRQFICGSAKLELTFLANGFGSQAPVLQMLFTNTLTLSASRPWNKRASHAACCVCWVLRTLQECSVQIDNLLAHHSSP